MDWRPSQAVCCCSKTTFVPLIFPFFKEPAADSAPADSDTIGHVSSLGAPQDSSVSDADNQWNRNEVNLTRLERDFFLPRNVLPDRPKSVYFRTNERLEFKDVLESIRGAGMNDRDIECIQFKRLSDDDVHY